MSLHWLSPGYGATRADLHRVAAHVAARARHAATGRFGLRATAGGFGTPAYGPENEVVRVSGDLLVVDRAGADGSSSRSLRISGTSLAELAEFAGVSLDPGFAVGDDTPDPGDPASPLHVDVAASAAAGAWLTLATQALDELFARLGAGATPSSLQLWPEHFDLGGDALVGSGRVNLGASLGDASRETPYLYVGPWDDRRPGGPSIWNTPFGALLGYEEVAAQDDPTAAAISWFSGLTAALLDP